MSDQHREVRQHGQQAMQHGQQAMQHGKEGVKSLLHSNGPSTTKIIATATLLPLGATLLALSGLTLAGTVVGLAVATPLFILFSPVLVPAAIVIGLAVAGFLSSGAMGMTGLTSLGWILKYVKKATERIPETMEQAKRRMGDAVEYAGQAAQYTGERTKDMGQQLKESRVTGLEAGKGHESS